MIQVKPGTGKEGGSSNSFFMDLLLSSLRENLCFESKDIQNFYNNTCLKGIPPLRSASPEDTTLFIGFNK